MSKLSAAPFFHRAFARTQPLQGAVGRDESQSSCRSRAVWLLPALLLSGCHGAIWAHFAVLAISVGIFVGTVSLRHQPSSHTAATRKVHPDSASAETGWTPASRHR